MCGVATGLVVLKTAVHAIDQDLEVTVLSDLCVDADQARHEACMDAVLPTLARVMPSDEWLATLGSGPDGSPQKTAAGALRGPRRLVAADRTEARERLLLVRFD